MVLSQWFERGLGQIFAPDKNYKPEPDDVDTRSSFWNFVAPDPRFASPSTVPDYEQHDIYQETTPLSPSKRLQSPVSSTAAPTMSSAAVALPSTPLSITVDSLCQQCQSKLCLECRKKAAITTIPSSFHTPTSISSSTGTDANNSNAKTSAAIDPNLQARVLEAATSLAETLIGNSDIPKKQTDLVFRLAASSTEIKPKLQTKLRETLLQTPSLLTSARAAHQACENGYTILMAAAYADHTAAAKIILEVAQQTGNLSQVLQHVDLQGKTALHIAAAQGNVAMVELLSQYQNQTFGLQSPAPVDLVGRTPYASAMTSPVPEATRNRRCLSQTLFSPKDISVLGSPAPAKARVLQPSHGNNNNNNIWIAKAEMPGRRCAMEDFTVTIIQRKQGSRPDDDHNVGIFCVADGHGDHGKVAQFVAQQLVDRLSQLIGHTTPTDWKSSCNEICRSVDSELKSRSIPGGAVAVAAVITKNNVVVVNVGDCRCILIAKHDNSNNQNTSSRITAKPLSTDHKPQLPKERERIETAGLKIELESFFDEATGKQMELHKVVLSPGNRMACSRSFGDFEYKANGMLGPDEQAIVAIPEVTVHARSSNDLYLVAACDGVWDVMSNEDVANFVTTSIAQSDKFTATTLPQIADELMAECLRRGSEDNMSVVIVALTDNTMMLTADIDAADEIGPAIKTLDFGPDTPELRPEK
jgi:serine/threonine protein phosphatase PrpC